MQQGDVSATQACTKKLEAWIDYKPNTPIKIGIAKFVDWYKNYFVL